ncbi:GtrA family protein [Microbacterium sp. SSW1-59]|uniref:GtrA family protein n=1 Tax=Microbacterium xanthum TaxID=3079794 RepID=UPI002AD31A85|nr:GtrA family protein [Microbacterium sp. SSW1-59]MDZ8200251.1 GtrA family protein [Microbacterium sp. SSW1-59]
MTTITPAARVAAERPGAARRIRLLLSEVGAFGLVGAIAFVIDVGGYNLLRFTVMPDSVVWAKVVSVTVATAFAYAGHRYLTFRSRRGRPVLGEALLFVVANAGGLLISAACLYVSHYVLGFTSTLADNIAGNVIGFALGTLFRYLTYRFVVFRPRTEVPA